jgi:hypothetical protein
MAKRRSLIQGVKTAEPVDRAAVEEYVFGRTPSAPTPSSAKELEPPAKPGEGKGRTAGPLGREGRASLTIRFRSHTAAALKRASLERQLKGVTPNLLQDILEEAVEPWLRSNGYLD